LDKPSVCIVEYEVRGHPVYEHVLVQTKKFNDAFKRTETRLKLAQAIHNEVSSDLLKKALVESKIKGELFKFFTDIFSQKPELWIIVDEATEELKEALNDLPFESKIVEFRTFEREGVGLSVHAHLINPYPLIQEPPIIKRPERESWDKRLEWVNEETRCLVKELIKAIEERFPGIQHMPRARSYYFYKGKERSLNSLFAVLMLTKKAVKVRIKADPNTFRDEKGWTKTMKGWFFPRKLQEREFTITEEQQIPYALELITQSYIISDRRL
jgi:predicted transport protein